jgi:uncharacterized protein (DUF1330 family)
LDLSGERNQEGAMGEKTKIVGALTLGIAIGAVAVPALRAQGAGSAAYVVAEMHVTDPAGFTQYMQREPATLGAFHGRVVARALPDVREGAAADGMVAILAFDSLQDANHWYNSPEYENLKLLRQQSAKSRLYFLSGIVQSP